MFSKTIRLTLPAIRVRGREFVAVERREWERIQRRTIELEHALKVIASGERALRRGKTRTVASLAELRA